MIVLFTDFGASGPYLGQMELAIRRVAPSMVVVNLLADAPRFSPRTSAYLLAALARDVPEGAVILAVVDPGVGGERLPLVVRVDGRWLVGPDNGLFELLIRRGTRVEAWEIVWRPAQLSASFHGRDLFGPVAARLALGHAPEQVGLRAMPPPHRGDWPDDLASIIYADFYGNLWTGLRATMVSGPWIEVGGHRLRRATTFCDAANGVAFWYENSSGLVEVAVNGGRAETFAGLRLGEIVTI